MLRYETAELLELLKTALGTDRPLLTINRRPWAYYSSYAMEEVNLQLEDGTILAAVVKDGGDLLPEARQAKPNFMLDPAREIAVFEDVLDPLGIDVPQCFGSIVDVPSGGFLLVLERVEGVPLWQVGEFQVWEDAARWAARLHQRCRGDFARIREATPVIAYDRAYYQSWLRRAITLLDKPANNDAARRSTLQGLVPQYERAVDVLQQLPNTFIHGEFQASNILVQTSTTAAARIRPVDWELAAIAPGFMDLADLCSGRWTPSERARLIGAYVDASGETRDDVDQWVDVCRFHRSIQWALWSDDWTPPREHAHNWLDDAAQLAATLRF